MQKLRRNGYNIKMKQLERKPRTLELTRFGNPILRQVARRLEVDEITSEETKQLIADMKHLLVGNKYGVGLAAPQVGQNLALSVIGVKPTPTRSELEPFETVIINPEIIEYHGEPEPMWEACVSCGSGDDLLYAQAMRHPEVTLRWRDESAQQREQKLGGFVAHVVQHEVDHLNGVLFVDRVKDATSFMMADEYRSRIAGK